MRKSIAVILIVLSIVALSACKEEPAHEHTWDEGVPTPDATCTEEGTMLFTCVCGETKTETIPAKGHSYELGWSSDELYHWHAATCEHTELFTDKAVHNWGLEGEITTPATHTQTGVRTYTCLNCLATKTETIPADASAHEYSKTWTADANYHWHQATCGHDVINDSAAHTFGEVKVTKAATCTASGTGTQMCSVCGYVKDVVIPALDHNMENHVCKRCGLFVPFVGATGGYVFYDCDADNEFGNADLLKSTECGWRYLEAAPERLKNSEGKLGIQFGYHRTAQDGANLFVNGTTVYNASNCTGVSVGTGKENTRKLVEAMGDETYRAFDTSGDYAARLCDIYSIVVSGVTYDDWFLPSADETLMIYTNLVSANLGGFPTNIIIWTSSENPEDASVAYCRYFNTGSFDKTRSRGTNYNVIPIRSFL